MSLYTMERGVVEIVKPWARLVFGIFLASVGLAGRASYRESNVDPGLALAYSALFVGIALLWGPMTKAVVTFVRELREAAKGS